VAPPVIEGNQIKNLGSQVTVVTEKQIDDLNAQDLPSALRKTPGVVISRHNPVGSFGGGELQNYFARLGYEESGNWQASMVFNSTNNWADDPGPIDKSIPPDGTFKTNDYFGVATLANRYENADGYIKLYSDNGNINWKQQYNETTKKNDEDTITDYANYGMRGREWIRPWEGGEVLLGMDMDAIGGKVRLVSPPSADRCFNKETWYLYTPYLSVSHMVGSKDGFYVTPSAGARYFAHSQFASEVGPQAGLKAGYRDTESHFFYSRGINYPGLFVKANDELFMPGDNRWKDLSAETVNHFEVGVSHQFSKLLKMDVTAFYDEGKNRIVVATPPPFPATWTNIGSYYNRGVEATLTVTPLDDLAFFAGVTYLDTNPSDLPYSPKWSASFGANYRFLKHFQLSLDALYLDNYYVGSRGRQTTAVSINKVDGYFLLNGKLSYDFRLPFRHMNGQLFIAGENLTNASYEQKYGYPMPGISGMGGLKLTFWGTPWSGRGVEADDPSHHEDSACGGRPVPFGCCSRGGSRTENTRDRGHGHGPGRCSSHQPAARLGSY
jgi:outer membrane receptor for monomeric catechols